MRYLCFLDNLDRWFLGKFVGNHGFVNKGWSKYISFLLEYNYFYE